MRCTCFKCTYSFILNEYLKKKSFILVNIQYQIHKIMHLYMISESKIMIKDVWNFNRRWFQNSSILNCDQNMNSACMLNCGQMYERNVKHYHGILFCLIQPVISMPKPPTCTWWCLHSHQVCNIFVNFQSEKFISPVRSAWTFKLYI